MIHFNRNLLTVVDFETTGRDCAFHDVVQVSVMPVDDNLVPYGRPFYQNVRPVHPARAQDEAMRVHGIPMDELMLCPEKSMVADAFVEWFRGLDLPVGKRLIPLTHNSPFDVPFFQQFLGVDLYYEHFTRRGRDTMYMALGINDHFAYRGLALPFNECGLKPLCKHFGIDISGHHDALADCIATVKVYEELLRMELP